MEQIQNSMEQEAPKMNISELEKLYVDADEADKELFSEQRSNILLISGDHYNKLRSNYFKRLRDSSSISQEQKIRLTKNHIQKIVEVYVNNIVATAPGVGFEPAQATELRDQKDAELNHAVWDYAKEKHGLEEQVQSWAEDFVGVGEVATKLFYDPLTDDIEFEEIFGFNLLIDPAATSPAKARHMIIRKMVDVKKLKKMFPDEEVAKYIQASADQTYVIFDRGRGAYQKTKDQCMVREYYFRPCPEYPNGYWFYTVKDKILTEGELPAGKFPIVFKPFKRLQTKSRGQSIVKVLRPFQMEINRAASKIAEHQITLGDDKLLIQHGTKVSAGASLPGVRTVNFTGMEPKVMNGRDGSQYSQYMISQITEMYNAASVEEKSEDSPTNLDPYALLFRSASQKKKFQLYIKRFEQFLIEVCKLYLELARYHFSDDKVIQMIGANERVNIAEFKNSDPLCYKIKVVAQADDVETKLGKQLVLNHALQYIGAKLDKEDIGKLLREMPYSNLEESFTDLTLDYDAATNDILALDRGEEPPVHENDPHPYMIRRLTNRMRQADFQFLDERIKYNYTMRLQAHEQYIAEQAKQIQAAQSGFCPTGGYLVACDFYVQTDPKDPSKTRRVRLPSESLQWLIDKLETQGASLNQLENVNQANLAQISQMIGGSEGAAPQAPALNQKEATVMAGGVPNVRASEPSNPNPGFNPGSPGFAGGF